MNIANHGNGIRRISESQSANHQNPIWRINGIAILFLAFVIAGCGAVLPKPNNVQTAAWEGVASYGLAAHIANQYNSSPECTNPMTVFPCSKAAIRAQIRAADAVAYAAVKQAEAAVRNFPHDPSTATKTAKADADIKALNDITGSKDAKETQQ